MFLRKGNVPVILLDCDGVLVDNVAFERRVTDMIVRAYAKVASLTPAEARKRWRDELAETRGHSSWFDYAYHCERLGLNGRSFVEAKHLEAQTLLAPVPGANETYHLLLEHGFEIGVVTDATHWVAEFKLKAMGFDPLPFIFSSSDASATKATREYWERLAKRFSNLDFYTLVDNRHVNLNAAREQLPGLQLVQFEMNEHVMTLPVSVAPDSNGTHDSSVKVVHNHEQLRSWVFRYT